jgi:hypothetical protein
MTNSGSCVSSRVNGWSASRDRACCRSSRIPVLWRGVRQRAACRRPTSGRPVRMIPPGVPNPRAMFSGGQCLLTIVGSIPKDFSRVRPACSTRSSAAARLARIKQAGAAPAVGISTGEWMTLGFLTEDGPHPEFAELYVTTEMPTTAYLSTTHGAERPGRDRRAPVRVGEQAQSADDVDGRRGDRQAAVDLPAT